VRRNRVAYIPYSPAGHHHHATPRNEKGTPPPASAAQTDPNPGTSSRPPGFRPVGGPPALVRGLNERTEVGAAAVGQRNRQAAGEERRRSCGAPLDSALDDPPAATAIRTGPISRVGGRDSSESDLRRRSPIILQNFSYSVASNL
jgi:hypothetical protein